MSKSSRPKNPTTTKKPNWRNNDDATYHGYPTLPSAESLHPGPQTVLKAVAGDEEAQAIICSYGCRLPVITIDSIDEEVSR